MPHIQVSEDSVTPRRTAVTVVTVVTVVAVVTVVTVVTEIALLTSTK